MTMQSGESSHPLLSCTDGIAASTTDLLLLVGRVFLGWLFLASAWPKLLNIAGFVGYLTALKVPAPDTHGLDRRVGGIPDRLHPDSRHRHPLRRPGLRAVSHRGDRAGAPLLGVPASQMQAQYTNFLKNLAILGGALLLFLTGPGRFSIDRVLSKPR